MRNQKAANLAAFSQHLSYKPSPSNKNSVHQNIFSLRFEVPNKKSEL